MEQTNFIEQLNILSSTDDLLSVSNEIKELKAKFEDYLLEEERKLQVTQLTAQENGEEIPENDGDFGKEAFFNAYSEVRNRIKEFRDAKSAVETQNLAEKKKLIQLLRDVITKEENIGAAFASFKEIQEKWKVIGDIPRTNRSEIQSEYSRLIEDFFYNINIYKELKDHDFHRNKQLKEEVIDKLKKLAAVKSIKEVEQHLKSYQNDWEDIGPVPNDSWDLLKDAYWTEVRSIYERINRFFEDKRNTERENIVKKEAVIAQTRDLLATMEEFNDATIWENKTKEIIALQDEWKKIGFGPKKENEEVWKIFRGVCDSFFIAKKEFFSHIHEKLDEIAQKKIALIEKADQLKTSTDWKVASEQFIQLQKQWKLLGNSGKRHEQKLWKKFRASCDAFFNAKTAFFGEKDKEFVVNLDQKKAIIEELKNLKLPDDKKTALLQLKDVSTRFNSIGHVPLKEKDAIFKAFKTALDQLYSSLKLEGKEKEETLFAANLETMKSNPNAGRQLDGLRFELKKEMDFLRKEITQLENNLGFFAKSKGADALRLEVEKKIKLAEEKILHIRAKLKLIPNE